MTGRRGVWRGLAAVAALLWLVGQAHAAEPFAAWLAALKAEARQAGISQATLEQAFAGVEPIERVIELDRRQPETRMTFEEYLERVVPPSRIADGRERYREYRQVLQAVGREYGVQPRFIVALWGIESDYGRNTGGFSVIAALATLAYDGRRGEFFRRELIDALKILDDGHITPSAMRGSWAGAMGQSQFMPSSFRAYAQDFDGDGRRDIWTSPADVFASAANYLARAGWRDDQTWGRAVRLPGDFDTALASLEVRKSLDEWQALGVRRRSGGDLPGRALRASVVIPPKSAPDAAFLVYDNYRALLKWNRSSYFAIAVGRLADEIGAD